MKARGFLPPMLLAALAAAWPLALPAQDAADEPAAEEADDQAGTTGDAWVDAVLEDIGAYARRHRDAFTDELVRYRDAPRELIDQLLDERGWEPGDVYFACSLARVAGRPCRSVADRHERSPQPDWSGLAETLEAGSGSEAFARIKRGVVRSYERWARPLVLDDELARAFPDHGRAPRGAGGAADSD